MKTIRSPYHTNDTELDSTIVTCRYASLNDGVTIVRRFRCRANVIGCTYTNLDSTIYCTLSLCIVYSS